MKVELGNRTARLVDEDRDAPTVTYVEVGDEYSYEVAEPGARMLIGPDNEVEVVSAADLAAQAQRHITESMLFRDGITHMPGQEALLAVVAHQASEGVGAPEWVWSDDARFQKLLAEFYGCTAGRPDDVEATHYTDLGPPGVGVDHDARSEAAAEVAVANEPNEE